MSMTLHARTLTTLGMLATAAACAPAAHEGDDSGIVGCAAYAKARPQAPAVSVA